MEEKQILGLPKKIYIIVITILILGIIIGSIYDFQISKFFSNKTNIGTFIEQFGNIVPFCLYPVAGICLYKGINGKEKWKKYLSKLSLVLPIIWGVINYNRTSGYSIREFYSYIIGRGGKIPMMLGYLTWFAIMILVAYIAYKLIDSKDKNKLIITGSTILIAGVLSITVTDFLKGIACRPRYKYLITLNDPISEFRNWWQISPFSNNDGMFKSWPSGHMTEAALMFTLPLIANVLKHKKDWTKYIFFAISIIWILIIGYNRIHMNAHFLTDICFGSLNTLIIIIITNRYFSSIFKEEEKEHKKKKTTK